MTPSRSELLRLLTGYHPGDEAEQRYRVEMLDLAAAAHDPFDRAQYEPGHFTASGFVVHPDGEQVLLVHHAKLGIWVQPGGHVDADDPSPFDAAVREVREETGIDHIRPVTRELFDIDVHVFGGLGDQPRHLHYDLRFTLIADDATLRSNAEVIAAGWFTLGDLAGLGVDESVRRPVGKVLGAGDQ